MSGSHLRAPALIMPLACVAVWATAFFALPLPQHVGWVDAAGWAAPYLAFAAVGGLIIRRQPWNRIGWLLATAGLAQGLGVVQTEVLQQVGDWPGWSTAERWLVLSTVWSPAVTLLLVLVVMTFPDGRLPSHRWRWVVAALVGMSLLVGADQTFTTSPSAPGLPPTALANAAVARWLDPITSYDLFALYLLVPVAALVARYRGGTATVREQIKWFVVGVATLVLLTAAGGVAEGVFRNDVAQTFLISAGMVAFAAGIGVAVVRHRLYDVDLVISRSLSYSVLAILATAVYVVVVVGIGAAVGRSSSSNLMLSIAATVLVAVAFNPVRVRVQTLANQLVYGRRQSPHESLSEFTRVLASAYGDREVLARMAESLARGVGATAAAVYLGPAEDDRLRAAWPDPDSLPTGPPSCTTPVSHRGERLGSLSVWTEEARQLDSTERALLDGLAAQAALVLRNERLTAELERRLEELRASRRRLASAQDAERRRLERDLHDGAQHDLVAIRMKLGLAEAEASATDNDRLAGLLAGLKEETAAALENIRGLVRGLHPPLLESQGLASALAAHARRLPLPVLVSASTDRFDPEVEAAVYFCCIEALHNVVKHSGASSARVTIDCMEGRLQVEVRDDGRGFDLAAAHGGSGLQNIADRMDALGGRTIVGSTRAGTSVKCELEAEPRQRAAVLRRAGGEGG